MQHNFSANTQEIAKKTYRPWNHNIPICYRLVFDKHVDTQNKTILDYGCSPDKKYVTRMLEHGIRAFGLDFHIPSSREHCLSPGTFYDLIIASNVLNVISTQQDLQGVINELHAHLTPHGTIIANYPSSPRKLGLTNKQLLDIIAPFFTVTKFNKKLVGNTLVVNLTKRQCCDIIIP